MKAGWGSRPDIYIEKAHADGEDVSGLTFSADGFTLLSRSLDETLKVIFKKDASLLKLAGFMKLVFTPITNQCAVIWY